MSDPLKVGDVRYGYFMQRKDGRFGRAYRVISAELHYANGPLYWVHDIALGGTNGQYAHHSELLTEDEIQDIINREASMTLAAQ